jgi:hypothetical protein
MLSSAPQDAGRDLRESLRKKKPPGFFGTSLDRGLCSNAAQFAIQSQVLTHEGSYLRSRLHRQRRAGPDNADA